MDLKDFWARTSSWLRAHKISRVAEYRPPIDAEGLIDPDAESQESVPGEQSHPNKNQVVVKAVQPKDLPESLDKLQKGFNELVGQLKDINAHLNLQVAQHEDLMGRLNKLPELLESFPAVVESQSQLTEQLLEQLKTASAKQQQFVETVERIPAETAKQTDALTDIDHQLAAAAETDVQMAESFNKFNETLEELNQSTIGQTEGIMQMSKTFATSDRYLKYLVSRQNKRFMWVFIVAVGVCVLAILILTGIVIYLTH